MTPPRRTTNQREGYLVLRLAKGNIDLGDCFTGGCGLSFLSLSSLISSLRAALGKFLIALLLSFASGEAVPTLASDE
jgi:hypothetical protein